MCWHQSNNWSGLKLNSELDSAVQNALTGPPVSDVPKEVTMHMRVFRLNTESHMEADISIKEVWDRFLVFFLHIAQINTGSVCLRDTV